jgi:hypothetical protein
MKQLVLIAPLALVACGQQPEPITTLPPAELRSCIEMPDAPSLPAKDGTEATQLIRDQMTLDYILGLRTAYADCAAKVAGFDAWAREVE